MAKTIHTDKAPAAIGPYVQGKIVGNLLFASGQVPLSPETGEIIGKTVIRHRPDCGRSDSGQLFL